KGLDHKAQARIDSELEQFSLETKKNRLIREYSFGMKKRIGLIAALLGEPQILILDEPLNGLHVDSITLMRERIKQLHAEGKLIIFSSHIMDFVERVSSRIVILKRGQIVADGTAESLRAEANAQEDHFEDVFFYFTR